MSLATGARLGPYEILGPLGAGGMGEVYRARDPRLGREVALKVLRPPLAADPDRMRRFEQEARAASALNHPGILTVFDVGSDGGRMFLVTELLAGRTLRDVLATGEPVPLARALDWGAQIARGLAAAHEQGIVHRDLKPENLFVGPEGRVKILDFGLAKLVQDDPAPIADAPTMIEATETGAVLGTAGYMAPEQVRGERVDARADLFALGCVLYELLGGRRAFIGDSAVETLHAILKQEPPPLAGLRAELPPSVVRLVDRCLAKSRADRFQSARDLAFALESATAAGSDARAAAPASPVGRAEPEPARRGRGALVAGAVVLLAVAAAAGWLRRRAPAPVTAADWSQGALASLTTDPGYEAEPTFSPDGETIAYVSDRDGDLDIYLQQVSGGPAINLTPGTDADMQPAFSPDGRRIAFVSDRESGRKVFVAGPELPLVGGGIWVMPALGGAARRITKEGNFPAWSPDGRTLAFVYGTFRHSRIATVAADGGEVRDLEIAGLAEARFFFPRFSDDGRWLLFQNGPSIAVAPAGGGAGRRLASGERPAWAPGAASIVFTSEEPGKNRTLWQAPFAPDRGELSGAPRPLTFGRGADLDAAFSRDGRSIVFAAADATCNIEELPFDEETGQATAPPRELTRGNQLINFFSTSPDGRSLVFGARRGSIPHLWRVTPPGDPVQLTIDPAFREGSPRWSPDGRWIAFNRRDSGETGPLELWRMTPEGADPRQIGEITGDLIWIDSRRLLARRTDDELAFYDIDGSEPRPFHGLRTRTLVTVDPAGEWVIYQTATRGNIDLEAVPLAGGPPRSVVATPAEDYHPFVSPSGRWLYFQPDHKNIFRVPGPAQQWRQAEPQRVTDFPEAGLYLEDPQIARDGSRLFYTRGRSTADLWLLRLGAPEPSAPAR